MTLLNHKNHFNVKFLKGYGHSHSNYKSNNYEENTIVKSSIEELIDLLF